MKEVRRLAGWDRAVRINFDPPNDGLLIRWQPVPASPFRPWSEHFVRFSDMNETALKVLQVRWMVEQ